MALIQIVAAREMERERLSGILRNLGMETSGASTLNDAVVMVERLRPRAVLLADETDGAPAEVMIRELLRVAPLVPVVVCMNNRDSARAVELMRLGAFDCVAPPWTEEAIRPVVRKALRISGTAMDLSRPRPSVRKLSALFLAVLAVAVGAFWLGRFYFLESSKTRFEKPSSWELPYDHPSGIAWDGKNLWILDWYSQSLYLHEPSSMSVVRVAHFPSLVPVGLCLGEDRLWLATASGYIEKRMIDDKFTLLSRYKFPGTSISGMCHDGLYFWTADSKEGKIRRHITDRELTVEKSYTYPGNDLAALACGPRLLWTVDGELGELLEHSLEEPEYVLSRKTLREFRKGKWKISGLAWAPATLPGLRGLKRRFWSVAEGSRLSLESSGSRSPSPKAEGKDKGMVFIHDIEVKGVHTGFD